MGVVALCPLVSVPNNARTTWPACVGDSGSPPTARALPTDNELRPLGVEPLPAGCAVRAKQRVLQGIGLLEVLDLSATSAQQMLVPIGTRIEQSGMAPRVHASQDAEVLEQLERGVDGGQGNAGQRPAHRVVHVLGAEMAILRAQEAVDDQPLRRDPLTALAQCVGEFGIQRV